MHIFDILSIFDGIQLLFKQKKSQKKIAPIPKKVKTNKETNGLLAEILKENHKYMKELYSKLFAEINYELKIMTYDKIVYGNNFSELIFTYNGQQYGQMNFTNLYYKKAKGNTPFNIKKIVKHLFNINTSLLLDDCHKKMITEEEVYYILIDKHMKPLIINNDFTWEEKLKYNEIPKTS